MQPSGALVRAGKPPGCAHRLHLSRCGDAKAGVRSASFSSRSQATVANVYLAMYPTPVLAKALNRDPGLIRRAWEALNRITPEQLLRAGFMAEACTSWSRRNWRTCRSPSSQTLCRQMDALSSRPKCLLRRRNNGSESLPFCYTQNQEEPRVSVGLAFEHCCWPATLLRSLIDDAIGPRLARPHACDDRMF